ncbi:MAG: CHASE2 domain-containing protein [Microscillaceae bacterium]|jgi:class 3 adenylate cyclase|nr:CHASE2 domain-containing protein [Microscillaceae bacterium]
MSKRIAIKLFLSLLNAAFLVWFVFFSQSLPYSLPDEYTLVRYSAVMRNVLLGLEKKPDSSRFLFINVAWDKVMTNYYDPLVPDYAVGVEPITNRRQLVHLLKVLAHRQDYKAVVLDIFFKGKTEFDSALATQINQMPRCLVSYHLNPDKLPDYPDLPIRQKLGLSDLEKVYDEILKFKLFYNDSIKTTPLLLYEQIHQQPFNHNAMGYWLNNRPVFNSFILDYRIRNYDYLNGKYAKLHLGEYLSLMTDSTGNLKSPPDEDGLKLLKNRIIVVGDFEDRDIHRTIYGDIPGPIILLDAFLALEAGDNRFSWLSIPFLLFIFTGLSYLAFFLPVMRKPSWLVNILPLNSLLGQLVIYFLVLIGTSISSYLIFNIIFSVFPIGIYLGLIANYNYQRKLKKANARLAREIAEKNRQIQSHIHDLENANNQLQEKVEEIQQQKEEIEAQRDMIETEQQKSEKLLLNILPLEVANELKEKGSTEVKHYRNASILFADVKGFSTLAGRVSPQELITELNATFTKMDEIIAQHNLERIKTIGDCYMCVGGVPHQNTTNPLDITLAALAIQQWMYEERIKREGDFWQIRLGIHTGELVAGVIGKTKFAYDVWGSAVNLASRMESGGEVGRVNVSEVTYWQIKDFFDFTPRGKIEAKNIGLIETYFVDRIKPALSADLQGFVPNEDFMLLKKAKFLID